MGAVDAESSNSQTLSDSQKRLILYFGVLVLALVWLYFPESQPDDAGSSPGSAAEVLGGSASGAAQESDWLAMGLATFRGLLGLEEEQVNQIGSVPVAQPVPTPAPPQSELTEREIARFEAAFEPTLSSLRVLPPLASQVPWLALERIESWYAAPEVVTGNELFTYLQHERLWVRLAALQFALSGDRDFSAVVNEAEHQIVRNEPRSQVRRFLKRAQQVNPEAFLRMKEVLKI